MSLAVWCKPKTSGASSKIEAHFNYWYLNGDNSFKRNDQNPVNDIIEIGIMVDNPEDIECIR
ncbi:MAG: hypothetical protein ABF714_12985, partial [Novacetimonas hansenii]